MTLVVSVSGVIIAARYVTHTREHQLKRHKELREIYLLYRSAFAALSSFDQWELHRFYDPSREHTLASLTRVQASATALTPSLPQQAGKSYKAVVKAVAILRRERSAPRPLVVASLRGQSHRPRIVRAYGLVRPEPDLNRILRVLIRLAEQQAEAEKKGQDG